MPTHEQTILCVFWMQFLVRETSLSCWYRYIDKKASACFLFVIDFSLLYYCLKKDVIVNLLVILTFESLLFYKSQIKFAVILLSTHCLLFKGRIDLLFQAYCALSSQALFCLESWPVSKEAPPLTLMWTATPKQNKACQNRLHNQWQLVWIYPRGGDTKICKKMSLLICM